MTKGNLFMSLKGNFRRQFVYTLHGVLAKIILRSCFTRDGAIRIKNSRFEYFDGTNPAQFCWCVVSCKNELVSVSL